MKGFIYVRIDSVWSTRTIYRHHHRDENYLDSDLFTTGKAKSPTTIRLLRFNLSVSCIGLSV